MGLINTGGRRPVVVVCITILEYIFHKLCDPFPLSPPPFFFKKEGVIYIL